MTIFTGTNGPDILPPPSGNNSGDDIFIPLLGADTVNGGDGEDLLIVNYASNSYPGNGIYPAGMKSSIVETSPGSFSGNYSAYTNGLGTFDQINFSNIERFEITGTNFNDVINTGWKNDSINAGAGNDFINAGGGIDTINGGAGTDTLFSLDAGNEIFSLTINNSGNSIFLSDGTIITEVEQFQNINTGLGNDTISFTDVLDHEIDSGAGNDSINTGNGNDTINGGIGNDTINPGLGVDSVDGDTGIDLLIVDYSKNTFAGTPIYSAGFISTVFSNGNGGWSGYYSAYKDANGNFDGVNFANIERFQIIGTNYNDNFSQAGYGFNIDGGNGVDMISNLDMREEITSVVINNSGAPILFNDGSVIRGVELFQFVSTGAGSDRVTFTDSLDHLISTGAGNDSVTTGNGRDTINGGIGNDTINAGLGINFVDGQQGDDVLILDYSSNNYAGNGIYNPGLTTIFSSYNGVGGWSGFYTAYKDGSGMLDQTFFYNIERFDLTGTNSNDSIVGASNNDTIRGGPGMDSLNGGDGIDTLSYAGSSAGVNVNLATNTASGGDATGDVISNFENLLGSNNNDTLIGNNSNNTINGGIGADSLNGGAGIDTLSYETSINGVLVNLATNVTFGGDASGDTISNFENVTGSNSNDTLTGSSGVNVIRGNGGDDLIEGRGGADILDGGVGNDTLSYENSPAGVNVSFINNVVSGGDAEGDRISNFENIIGSRFNDRLIGNAANNVIKGGAGGDFLDGGLGIDTLIYDSSPSGVNINLASNTAIGGDAAGDSIFNIENVTGSNFNDTLTGNDANNVLLGGPGNDTISGGAGNDLIQGGAGADNLDGGLGINTLSYETSSASVYVDLSINVAGGNGDGAGDVIRDFDILIGTSFNDILIGNANDNTIIGGPGADMFNGGAGIDTLSYETSLFGVFIDLSTGLSGGGDAQGDLFANFENVTGSLGADFLIGNSSNNVISGGEGNDSLNGGGGSDTLTGGPGVDRFVYSWRLTDSLLANFDVITDFNASQDLFLTSTARTSFTNAGGVAALTTTEIANRLNNAGFGANAAAQFSFGRRVFVAINDTNPGFNADTDAIVELTTLTGTLSISNFVTS